MNSSIQQIGFVYNPQVPEAINLCKTISFAKFDETVDLAFRLGVDPRHADQMIRGALALPAGTGKNIRVAVMAKGDKANLTIK